MTSHLKSSKFLEDFGMIGTPNYNRLNGLMWSKAENTTPWNQSFNIEFLIYKKAPLTISERGYILLKEMLTQQLLDKLHCF